MTDGPDSPATPTPAQPPPAPTDAEHAVLAAMAPLGVGALAERMGIEMVQMRADRVVARMPVEGNTQPYGLLHGGASAVLAETVGSIAAALHAGPARVALGIELSCSHHRAMRSGWVTGTATPLARTRSVATYAIAITDDAGDAVCSARLTCLLRDARPGAS